jgi:hypothetical protein
MIDIIYVDPRARGAPKHGVTSARLWLQHPPRVQWCLRVVYHGDEAKVIVRTWFHDYGPQTPPPDGVARRALRQAEVIARTLCEAGVTDDEVNFTAEVGDA